ncbi:MAG TPA: alpha/beta hydrolase [Trebonia sp.]|nr:alpha/beta hydrolase [Trebonia sp.]
MARMDLRLRAWGAAVRRQSSVVTRGEAATVAMQSRKIPDGGLVGWILGKAVPGTVVGDRSIPGPGGDIPVRVYAPAGAGARAGVDAVSGPRPLVLYFHGGGFVFGGGLRMGDWVCSQVATNVGAVVVAVDYRLAPTHRFPAAVEDSYAALVWAAKNAAELAAEGPIGVMGESAGGNLSAVICLLARDRGGPAVSHQALIYPAANMTAHGKSAATPQMPFLSPAEMNAYRAMYLGPDGDPADPMASPLLAEDHSKLPPALVQVAEHDLLRAEGISYAAALRAAGVPVRLTEYVGMPHGFLNFPGLSRSAPQALAELCAEQTLALATPEEPTA